MTVGVRRRTRRPGPPPLVPGHAVPLHLERSSKTVWRMVISCPLLGGVRSILEAGCPPGKVSRKQRAGLRKGPDCGWRAHHTNSESRFRQNVSQATVISPSTLPDTTREWKPSAPQSSPLIGFPLQSCSKSNLCWFPRLHRERRASLVWRRGRTRRGCWPSTLMAL
jgi:hypothetical protein